MKPEIIFISIFYLFLTSIYLLQPPGRKNINYPITNYYGSRYLDASLCSSFLQDSPSIVNWSQGRFLKNGNESVLWIADTTDQTIRQLTNRRSSKAGYRDGDYKNSVFNSPKALVYFESNTFPDNKTSLYRPYLFSSNSQECLNADYTNYTSCVSIDLSTLQYEQIIDKTYVKLIYFPNNSNTSYRNQDNNTIYKYLFISDQGNNCIRKINMNTAEVSTYAGVCGVDTFGFSDGPIGVNRFNQPDGLGVDDDGNLFVFDSGNNYMRMIQPNGHVVTLVSGAFFKYSMMPIVRNVYGYHWIVTSGMPDQQIYVPSNKTVCLENIVLCKYTSPLI